MALKTDQHKIRQFGLPPTAKAGILVTNMQHQEGPDEHDISSAHRDSHFLLVMATNGRFKLNIDFEEVAFTAPAMLCVCPSQVHQVLEVKEPQGWVIVFDPLLPDNEFQLLLENRFKDPVLLKHSSAFYEQAVILLDLMEKVQSGTTDNYTGKSVHSLLNALLCLIASNIYSAALNNKTKENRGDIIEEAFKQLLKKYYKTWKNPAQYASELAITVSHLNDTIKAKTGTSVSAHIHQVSILEAKRLLYFTDKSVKEIGYEVGYDEPVYFGKLFKKVSTFTPLQFRQQFR